MVELLFANESSRILPVVFKLKQADGQALAHPLCVGEQCILGDGSDTAVSDPVVLPSMFETAVPYLLMLMPSWPVNHSRLRAVEPQVAGVAPQQNFNHRRGGPPVMPEQQS